MFDIFGWIRNYARQAVLAGLADAARDIASGAVGDGAKQLELQLKGLSLPAPEELPEPEANGESRKKAKVK